MKIRAELVRFYSKEQAVKVAAYVGADEERFEELLALFFEQDYRIVQRAAAVVAVCVDTYPFLITPYLDQLVENLKNDIPDAVKRNTVRLLQNQEVPGHLIGPLSDRCFKFLRDKSEAVAVRVFSMSVLLNIVRKIPELGSELKWLIEDELPYASAGFISRGKKVLKELNKMGY
jgi:hypothetical protein